MPRHVLHIPDLSHVSDRLTIDGDEASHALRVKRIRDGEIVLAMDGAGHVATCRVAAAGRSLEIDIESVERFDPVSPQINVWSAAPKGPRLGELIDNLSQAGAAGWTPLRTERANVDPTAAKRKRINRIVMESMKQCRRPWALETHPPQSFEDAMQSEAGETIVLADASGEPYEPTGAERIRLLIGPEGGWSESERNAAALAGVQSHRFGPHIMRIEFAAAAACAVMLDRERA